MAEVPFDRLVEIYANIAFDADAEHGRLVIASDAILQDLLTIDRDPETARSTNLVVVDDDLAGRAVGDTVAVLARAPRLAYGVLAKDLDALLRSPRALIEEPRAYFVIEGGCTRSSAPVPAVLEAYRLVLSLVALFAKAAAFLDPVRQELVYVKDGKVPIPVNFDATALRALKVKDAADLVALFSDDVHEDQRLSILASAIIAACAAQPTDRRFRFLIENLDALAREVRDGYRLFASEFTYAKIRRDVETAQFDYLVKIHKTFTDIQGQLLGIPVATLVVTSQLKVVHACGLDFWSDLAVLAGAWVFVVLVAVAIANQWLTLEAIADEIKHQKRKLDSDYRPIADKFSDVFSALTGRIHLHRVGFVVIAGIAVGGAALATYATTRVIEVNVWTCVRGRSSPTTAAPTGGGMSPATTPSAATPPAPTPAAPTPASKASPAGSPSARVSAAVAAPGGASAPAQRVPAQTPQIPPTPLQKDGAP